MDYSYLLSQALLKLGEEDLPGAEALFRQAEAAAARVDPEGPRVAEVLGYLAQHLQAQGRSAEAQALEARRAAIAQRFEA